MIILTSPPTWCVFLLSFFTTIFTAIAMTSFLPWRPVSIILSVVLDWHLGHFTVEIAKCSCILYPNSLFSGTSLLWNYFPASCFAVDKLQNLNATPIVTFCPLEFRSFYCPFFSATFTQFPSLCSLSTSVNLCALAVLLPWLGRKDVQRKR